ncbi:PRD domain-containing protein [Xylocopilactobacillus apis]|uniref:Transcription antitermination protein BlgG n=1 Tax=Xylocopilactobacillus apis TaxID=2932183 RepID=A0AAU9D7Q0_9LACO|nr:PRD domain-containing protein [Xylocopilactobacillus apis]BDR56807.1 transcription antitermination protein BlgG [Xylocopilactobacillus apis]
MIFVKNFNNNIALVKDQNNTEWVVIGNGIGFGKKPGDQVDQSKISRRFVAADEDSSVLDTLSDISDQTVLITNEVVKMVEPILNAKFNSYQYLVLADHIEFTIQRAGTALDLADGTTRWSVKKLFPQEYEAAQKAVRLIEKMSKLKLSSGEVVFITYHFLNLRSDAPGLHDTIKITKLIEQVVEIVQYEYGINLDSDSFNFNRFITHLRSFMIQHLRKAEGQSDDLDPAILKLMIAKYPHAYKTVERIGDFLQNKTGWQLQPDEKVYLTLHIWRVTHRHISE